jgi:hypothetical protein
MTFGQGGGEVDVLKLLAHTFLKVSMTKQILRADSVSATTALRNR